MVHHITPADNSSKHVATGPAFFSANAGAVPDSLIVDANAYLIADSGDGVHLIGLWAVTVNGALGTFNSFSDSGLIIDPDLAPGLSHVTIGVNGDVFGATGIEFNVGGSITNKGFVSGGFHSAIGGSSDDNLSVNNSGIIRGGAGGAIFHSGAGDLTVKNSGTMTGGGNSTITQVGAGELTVINSGLIECQGTFGIETVNGVLNLVNTGTIVGVDAGQRSNINREGAETHVTNTGTFVGNIQLSQGGDDFFTNFKKVKGVIKDGTVTGTIDLGPGNNVFNGGGKHETVRDGGGTDSVKLGAGNDTYLGVSTGLFSPGNGTLDGGASIDTYDASGAANSVIVNLDTIEHALDPDNPDAGSALALTASGVDLSTDHITGFENVIGATVGDVIFGSNAANVLIGNDGNDTLAGLGGADTLTGGADADTFRFLKISDSTPKARDLITDFQQGLDKLDIDAILNLASVGLTLIGFNQFHHLAGEFREAFSHGNTILSGDLDGDAKADFSIVLKGHYLLNAGDFGF